MYRIINKIWSASSSTVHRPIIVPVSLCLTFFTFNWKWIRAVSKDAHFSATLPVTKPHSKIEVIFKIQTLWSAFSMEWDSGYAKDLHLGWKEDLGFWEMGIYYQYKCQALKSKRICVTFIWVSLLYRCFWNLSLLCSFTDDGGKVRDLRPWLRFGGFGRSTMKSKRCWNQSWRRK